MSKIRARLWLIIPALAIQLFCHLLTVWIPIPTTFLKVAGSYLAVVASTLLLCFFPLRFHITAQIFVVLAASMGNCMNLYGLTPHYDLLIHFLSGTVLALGGWELDKRRSFALLFSWAGAGLWEIFEFSCDYLLHAGMQGATTDTMTDMIAGFLGALLCLPLLRGGKQSSPFPDTKSS